MFITLDVCFSYSYSFPELSCGLSETLHRSLHRHFVLVISGCLKVSNNSQRNFW